MTEYRQNIPIYGILIYCTYLPQTVATIGSGVETLKTQIKELNAFKNTASKQIEEINQKSLQVKLLLYLILLKSYEKQKNCVPVCLECRL